MNKHSKNERPRSIADIERAAWFARLAFGAPAACVEQAPAMPQREPTFFVIP